MSLSRIFGVIALIGGISTAVAGQIQVINPKLAGILTGVGLVIAAFTERVHGGLSTTQDSTNTTQGRFQ